MRINLREEETTNYLGFYQDFLESIQQLNRKVSDVLNEIMQESRYDKLQQKISQIIDTYTETIVGNVENGVFVAWVESKASLRSCLKTYKAGEAADEVCAQIEQTMGDLMQSILIIEKADAIITERILNPTKSAENHLFNLALSIKGGQVNEKSYICALKDIKRTTLGKRSRLKHSDYYISTDKKVAELMIRRNKPIWYKDVVLDGLKSGEDRKGEMREMVKDCQWFLDNATVRTVVN